MKRKEKILNMVLGSFIFVLVLMLMYLIYTLASREEVKGNTLYLSLPILGIIVFSFSLWLKTDVKKNIILFSLTTIICIFFLEVFLSFTTDIDLQRSRARIAHKMNIPFDIRSIKEVVVDLRENRIDAYPSIVPTSFIKGHNRRTNDGLEIQNKKIFPLSGISNKTTVLCNEAGKPVLFRSDKHGFNNPQNLHKKERNKIVILGDSFIHGYCVESGMDIVGNLRQSGFNVLNLGMGGNSLLLELATLIEYAEPLSPLIVLWAYFEGNDLEDLMNREKNSPTLMNYLEKEFSQNLLEKQDIIDSALINYTKPFLLSKKKQHRKRITVKNVIILSKLREKLGIKGFIEYPPPPLFEEILRRAKETVSSWGGYLCLIYLPSFERYSRNMDYHRNRVKSIVLGLDIPIIDIHDVFSEHPDPKSLFPFRMQGHYTSEGNAIVSIAIEQHLNEVIQ